MIAPPGTVEPYRKAREETRRGRRERQRISSDPLRHLRALRGEELFSASSVAFLRALCVKGFSRNSVPVVGDPNLHSPPENVVIAAVSTDTHGAIDAVWRIESAKVIAGLTRIVRDVGLAEDLAQEALLIALEEWPQSGVPENPGAWLMSTAKHRAIDHLRRGTMLERKHEELGREVAVREMKVPDLEAALDATLDAGAGTRIATQPDTDDDLLRLVFMTCHPVLPTEGRVALTLRLLGGLTSDEIARAFLVSEPTVAQRIVRAKRTLAEKQVPFETPRAAELAARLASVLEVIYLIFNEGYSATAGDNWMRPALCDDALRLGRILAELMPREAEVHGLVSLMEIQASRARARVGPSGEPVLLLDQNRAHWDQLLIGRGLASLKRAEQLRGARGPYALQAAIAACHGRARTPAETDWARIVELYGELARLSPSPIVELNRAVAIAMASGPAAGLKAVDALTAEPYLKDYHLLPSVRGDLLSKLGRLEEASVEFQRAASLTRNARERDLLLERAASCSRGEVPVR
jgi:RNA polymerase sigma-70 factor, ECF subfamily